MEAAAFSRLQVDVTDDGDGALPLLVLVVVVVDRWVTCDAVGHR